MVGRINATRAAQYAKCLIMKGIPPVVVHSFRQLPTNDARRSALRRACVWIAQPESACGKNDAFGQVGGNEVRIDEIRCSGPKPESAKP